MSAHPGTFLCALLLCYCLLLMGLIVVVFAVLMVQLDSRLTTSSLASASPTRSATEFCSPSCRRRSSKHGLLVIIIISTLSLSFVDVPLLISAIPQTLLHSPTSSLSFTLITALALLRLLRLLRRVLRPASPDERI